VVSVCDGRGCVAFAFRELLGNRSVGRVELVDAFDEYAVRWTAAAAGQRHRRLCRGGSRSLTFGAVVHRGDFQSSATTHTKGSFAMDEYESLSHTKRDCKYHIIFIPKYRRRTTYVELRPHLGQVFRRLAQQKESRIEEGQVEAERWTRLDAAIRMAADDMGFIDLRPDNPGKGDPQARRLAVGWAVEPGGQGSRRGCRAG
jgi:hypothetical protein